MSLKVASGSEFVDFHVKYLLLHDEEFLNQWSLLETSRRESILSTLEVIDRSVRESGSELTFAHEEAFGKTKAWFSDITQRETQLGFDVSNWRSFAFDDQLKQHTYSTMKSELADFLESPIGDQ